MVTRTEQNRCPPDIVNQSVRQNVPVKCPETFEHTMFTIYTTFLDVSRVGADPEVMEATPHKQIHQSTVCAPHFHASLVHSAYSLALHLISMILQKHQNNYSRPRYDLWRGVAHWRGFYYHRGVIAWRVPAAARPFRTKALALRRSVSCYGFSSTPAPLGFVNDFEF